MREAPMVTRLTRHFYAGVELMMPTGMVRMNSDIRAILLSGQQAGVLAVLISSAGTPRNREEIRAAMPLGLRPPTVGQIGVVVSTVRKKLGADRIVTGAGGWWLEDPTTPGSANRPELLSYADLTLDVEYQRVWLNGRQRAIGLGRQGVAVLRALIEAEGRPCSRDQIWRALPEAIRPASATTIGVIIYHLRARLGRQTVITAGGGWCVAGSSPVATRIPDTAEAALWLNPLTRQVHLAGQAQPVGVSRQEAAILQVLINARSSPLNGGQVFARMPPATRPKTPLVVSTFVSRLRHKLGRNQIVTRPEGWCLAEPVTDTTDRHGEHTAHIDLT